MLLTLAIAAPSARANDAQDRARSVEQSAQICPGHSRAHTTPGVHAVPVSAVRVLQQRGYVLCPDRRLTDAQAVVFYPAFGVFGWNPDRPGSIKALARVVTQLTGSDAFPQQITVWDANAKPLQHQVVPSFTPRIPSMMLPGD